MTSTAGFAGRFHDPYFGGAHMVPWVEAGDEAPDFTLPGDDGSMVSLQALRGNPVVLYFYPRDDTPGCTKEACAFRDQKAELRRLGAKVFGVSTDDLESHRKFRDKFSLNFPLLADSDHQVAARYGAWREKVRFGKTSWGMQRSTFLIDAEGVVRKVWKDVQVDGHDREVIEAVQEIQHTAGPAR
jgi:thioredoxin-dependent peroxiredoxin